MFSFKFHKKSPNPEHPVFGKLMIKSREWHSYNPLVCKLCNYNYQLEVYGPLNPATGQVYPVQEQAYLRFCDEQDGVRSDLERVLEEYCRTASPSMSITDFTPTCLLLGSNGECAIEGLNDAEDGDLEVPEGLTIAVYPKVSVVNRDEYYDSVFDLSNND